MRDTNITVSTCVCECVAQCFISAKVKWWCVLKKIGCFEGPLLAHLFGGWLAGHVVMASPMCVCDVVVGVAFLLLYFLNENSSASFFNDKTSHFDVRE